MSGTSSSDESPTNNNNNRRGSPCRNRNRNRLHNSSSDSDLTLITHIDTDNDAISTATEVVSINRRRHTVDRRHLRNRLSQRLADVFNQAKANNLEHSDDDDDDEEDKRDATEEVDGFGGNEDDAEYLSDSAIDLDYMISSVEQKHRRKRRIREFLAYIPFLIVFAIFFLHGRNVNGGYYLTFALTDMLITQDVPNIEIYKSFMQIGNLEDYWEWAEGVLISELFKNETYAGDPKQYNEYGYVYTYNKLLGSLRLRQMRVRGDSCKILPRFDGSKRGNPFFDPHCYSEYSPGAKDVAPFGPNEMWKWGECSQIGGGYYFMGKKSTYDCSGYATLIPFYYNLTQAMDQLYFLRDNYWTDRQTRALFHEFFLYNANLNYFASAKLVLEFTAAGAIIPLYEFRNFRLFEYDSVGDYVLVALSLLLPLYVLYYIYSFIKECFRAQREKGAWYRHFQSIWTILDIFNIAVFLAVFAIRGLWVYLSLTTSFNVVKVSYPDLDNICLLYLWDMYLSSVNALLSFLRVFKFFRLWDRLDLLSRTVSKSAWDLVSLAITMIILLLAFAIMGTITFGHVLDDFKSFDSTLSFLLRTLIGDTNYTDNKEGNRLIYPFYFALFICFGFFLLLNMFLAVINDAFGEAKSEVVGLGLLAAFKKGVMKQLRKFSKKGLLKRKSPKHIDATLTAADASSFRFRSESEIIRKLKKYALAHRGQRLSIQQIRLILGSNIPIEVIERIVKRYGADEDGTIGTEDIIEIDNVINEKNVTPTEGNLEPGNFAAGAGGGTTNAVETHQDTPRLQTTTTLRAAAEAARAVHRFRTKPRSASVGAVFMSPRSPVVTIAPFSPVSVPVTNTAAATVVQPGSSSSSSTTTSSVDQAQQVAALADRVRHLEDKMDAMMGLLKQIVAASNSNNNGNGNQR